VCRSTFDKLDNPDHGSSESDSDTRNGGPLRKWSCGSRSCRRPAYSDRADDERTDHYDRNDSIDNDEHGSDDDDQHGDDDYACGNRDDDLDNSRLVTASEGGSCERE
jgi:hypothetical protein